MMAPKPASRCCEFQDRIAAMAQFRDGFRLRGVLDVAAERQNGTDPDIGRKAAQGALKTAISDRPISPVCGPTAVTVNFTH